MVATPSAFDDRATNAVTVILSRSAGCARYHVLDLWQLVP